MFGRIDNGTVHVACDHYMFPKSSLISEMVRSLPALSSLYSRKNMVSNRTTALVLHHLINDDAVMCTVCLRTSQ